VYSVSNPQDILITRLARYVLLAIGLMTGVADLNAGVNTWTSVGPPGADVNGYYGFVIDPSNPDTLYVTAYGFPGLWRSRDRGASWELLGADTPIVADLLRQVVVDAQNPSHLLGISGFYFWESFDGGNSWTRREFPTGTGDAESIAVSRDSMTIYVGAAQLCVFRPCCCGGVEKSTDGGRSWTKTALNKLTIGLLDVDPVDPRIVYAAGFDYDATSHAGTLFRTRDGGRNWVRIGPAVPIDVTPSGTNTASHLLIDPRAPSNLFLSSDAGLWTSVDGGGTWTNVRSTAPFTQILGLADDPLDPGAIFAATAGAIQQPPPQPQPQPPPCPLPLPCPPLPPCPLPCPPPRPADALFGVIRSSDHGITWSRFIDAALPPSSVVGSGPVFGFSIDPRRNVFYEIRNDGLFGYSIYGPRRRAVRP
jgi:hypothetical protein